MLMKVNPFSRNSPTRAVPKRNSPRMTLFLRACSTSFCVAAPSSGEVYAGGVVIAADAHHGFRATVADGAEHGGKLFVTHGAVLGIDQQPVVTAVGELLSDGGAVSVEKQSEFGFAFAQLLLEVSATKGLGHGASWDDER